MVVFSHNHVHFTIARYKANDMKIKVKKKSRQRKIIFIVMLYLICTPFMVKTVAFDKHRMRKPLYLNQSVFKAF